MISPEDLMLEDIETYTDDGTSVDSFFMKEMTIVDEYIDTAIVEVCATSSVFDSTNDDALNLLGTLINIDNDGNKCIEDPFVCVPMKCIDDNGYDKYVIDPSAYNFGDIGHHENDPASVLDNPECMNYGTPAYDQMYNA